MYELYDTYDIMYEIYDLCMNTALLLYILLYTLFIYIMTSENGNSFMKYIFKMLLYYLPGAVTSPLPSHGFNKLYVISAFSTCALL